LGLVRCVICSSQTSSICWAPSSSVEEAFGWIKTVGGQRKSRFKGLDRVGWAFTFAATAYNLVRLPRLLAETH